MALSLLLLNSFTLHTLFWAGLLCFLWSGLRGAGIKPTTILSNLWQTMRARFKSSKFAWPGAGVRTKRPEIEAHRAFQLLRIIGPSLCLGAAIGWGIHDIQEYHSTYVLANAAVEGQQDVYLSYHFLDDPRRRTYGLKFCDDYVPDLQPHQIIEVMIYVRKHGCESIASYKAGLKLRRINGVPILEGE